MSNSLKGGNQVSDIKRALQPPEGFFFLSEAGSGWEQHILSGGDTGLEGKV